MISIMYNFMRTIFIGTRIYKKDFLKLFFKLRDINPFVWLVATPAFGVCVTSIVLGLILVVVYSKYIPNDSL